MTVTPALVGDLIRTVADFPHEGISFFDIAPLLASPEGFAAAVATVADGVARQVEDQPIDAVVGVEARGFIIGAPVAHALGCGFVPVRKPGKLPGALLSHEYDLEYGHQTLTVQADALRPGAKVVIVDDVLATGGTIVAAAALVQQLHAEVIGVSVLLELSFLPGRDRLTAAGLTDVTSAVLR